MVRNAGENGYEEGEAGPRTVDHETVCGLRFWGKLRKTLPKKQHGTEKRCGMTAYRQARRVPVGFSHRTQLQFRVRESTYKREKH